MEVVYVSDGEVVMNVNGKDRVIPEGNATLILPFEQHSFHTAKNSHCLVIEFSPEIILDFYDMIKEKLLLTEVFKIDKNIIDLCSNILPNETISSV
jgi:hypothetical protein